MAEAPDPSIVSDRLSSGIGNDETIKEVTELVTHTTQVLQQEPRILPNQMGCDTGIHIIKGNNSQIISDNIFNVYYPQPPKLAPGRHQAVQRDRNSAQISDAEEYDSKIFRVVVFSQEMKDHNTEHMTITVWFCLDSNYKGVLVAEHEHGNITLDSHDTFRLGEGSLGEGIQRQPPVTVTMEANNSNAWNPDKYQKEIHALQIWKAGKAKCSFKLQKEPTAKRNQLYITLTIHQEVNGERKETEFILQKRICDIRMTEEQKATLVEQVVSANLYQSDVFSVVPYVNKVSHMDEDLILTVWMCPMNDGNTVLNALEEEQRIHSKAKLDSENSFMILDWEKPVMADIKMNDKKWEIHNLKKQKKIETSKLSGGQTKCQFALNRLDESPDINVKISLWQAEENNEIEFCTTTKLEKFQVVDHQQQSTHIPPLMTLNIPEPKHYQGSRTSETAGIPRPRRVPQFFPTMTSPARTKFSTERTPSPPRIPSPQRTPSPPRIPSPQRTPSPPMHFPSEFKAKIFRVIPLVLMTKDATRDISFIIVICEDDENVFNNDLRQLVEAEYLPLDNYDTLLINCSTLPVEVSCTLQNTEAAVLPTTMERYNVASLIESRSAKCIFRWQRRVKDVSSMCLLNIHQKEMESLGVSFALQIKDNNDRIEDHTSLANILLGRNCQSRFTPNTDPDICFVLPYINGLQNLTDDVVITVWLCSFDNESKALKELEHEQYHVGRMKLDSPNTFIILDKDKPITVEITGLQTKNKVQSVSTKRVSEGGHAKVQFVCQLLHRVDENSWIDLDITVKQEEELNTIQFISRKKVSKLTHIEDLFKKGATELPRANLEGKQEEKKE